MTRITDLCRLAAGDLRRLAREQNAASPMSVIATRMALATSRGEAACAMVALRDAIGVTHATAWARAAAQVIMLRSREPIPSATLTAQADGWDAYAATLATPPHVAAGQAALAERGSLDAVLAGDGLRQGGSLARPRPCRHMGDCGCPSMDDA